MWSGTGFFIAVPIMPTVGVKGLNMYNSNAMGEMLSIVVTDNI